MLSIGIAALALLASGMSAWTANKSLDFTRKTNADGQRMTLFSQFQLQYGQVAARLPAQLLDKDFRPADGTGDYAALSAYWTFCFAEYYATHRVNPETFGDLWNGYYVPLIADGLEIPSLRYALENDIATNRMTRGDWVPFLVEIARIARISGQPLSPSSERRLHNMVAERSAG